MPKFVAYTCVQMDAYAYDIRNTKGKVLLYITQMRSDERNIIIKALAFEV